jgi:hypothetical protein
MEQTGGSGHGAGRIIHCFSCEWKERRKEKEKDKEMKETEK